MGIQATATDNYCPQFIFAMSKVAKHPDTSATFNSFKSPWLFLENIGDYCKILEEAGFVIDYSCMETEKARYSVEQVWGIFKSGAENGYLNQAYYVGNIDQNYIEAARKIIKDSFSEQADEKGIVDLAFNRVYLIARKPLKFS